MLIWVVFQSGACFPYSRPAQRPAVRIYSAHTARPSVATRGHDDLLIRVIRNQHIRIPMILYVVTRLNERKRWKRFLGQRY